MSRGIISTRNKRRLDKAQDLLVKARTLIEQVAEEEEARADNSSDFAKDYEWRNRITGYLEKGTICNSAIKYVQAARFANYKKSTLE